ncbi:hypothetical protein LOTGIDRAFT_235754 [Lottia gigantea]|uniref:Saposin B-type domain-containing protein n=1 Tax=Lottia gigantea TaxID=225164 RepID=V3ZTA6_LOTGI|nr:hypothetical protein LOTGIDRAFT_235754 [Lottia gigantea]ESO85795.1 hypothetical protein LOTGIDRAFT_235754 [Lottia gigantea]
MMKVFVLLAAVACVYGIPNDDDNRLGLAASDTVDVNCKACQDIIKDLRTILNSNKTQTLIENFLEDRVCSMLGQSAAMCKQYVQSYAPLLFQLMVTELDSLKLCSIIGLCTTQQQILKQPVDESPMLRIFDSKPVNNDKSFGTCFICKMVLKKLYEELGQHATEAEIEAYLDKVCNFLPSTFRSECVSLINEFTPTIIKLVLQKMTPEQICVQIHLCSKAQSNDILGKLFYISPVN